MELSSKAKKISPSLTLAITAKAKELKAKGVDIVSFGAGEPDFDTPENIQEAGIKAIKAGLTRYTAASGIVELKAAITEKFQKDNNLTYKKSQIIVSTGAKQCLANAFQAILNPGEEVIIPGAYWVSYPELIQLADGVPVIVETKEENEFKYNIDELKAAINDKTKAILVNSPNNPTGTVYGKEDLEKIAEIAKEHDLVIISDEIYEKLLYGEEKHVSIASLSEDAYNRTIVINGVSKAYAMTGWRIGYAAASEEITKLMTSLQSHVTSNPNSVAQYAALEALTGDQNDVANMVKAFEKRRDFMVETVNQIDSVSCIKPKGAFYVMVNISETFGKSINGKVINTSMEFAEAILEEEKVAVIPGIAFGMEGYIRLSYATSMELIKEGLKRLENFIKKMQ
ncbi:pyridoxal phosphate-dependent aminotransferase [Oceanirhabdus seepicola]|uniref:Aminotransferase n=1 Tax=Oceanirhabdus seepicola TaxID=2828781 RepID=A0A9J6P4R9_9CLOT|nr:pyridoxal phosphate-dependent aminotransferase [Oceanirhabdus seepicola]MCM1991134.1 pyridoxal phosphate-dependent aminotransferase [Oceanirhabdus seepicola]